MIISTDAENCKKFQNPHEKKMLSKLCLEGMHLNIIKVTHDKPTANITFNSQHRKSFFSKVKLVKKAHSRNFR